jgi:hypothetical protein
VVFSISNGGIGLISSKVIAPTGELGFSCLHYSFKVFVGFCSFFLKAIVVSNLRQLLFQAHFKSM